MSIDPQTLIALRGAALADKAKDDITKIRPVTLLALLDEIQALTAGVRKVHAAKGRHHSQLAMCDLFDLVGLANVRPGEQPKTI